MRVTVFGASGKVGQMVTKKLLLDGYDVVAFVHKSSPFKEDKNLTIVKGDVHNVEDVEKAIKGADVVISTLGSWGTKSKDVVSSGIGNIIEAMSKHNILRVVSLTGSDAIAKGEHMNFIGQAMRLVITLSPARKILVDGESHIELLQSSQLNWTVLRSPVMNERGNVKQSIITNEKPMPWETINRQSVAETIVALINDKRQFKKAPFIRRVRR